MSLQEKGKKMQSRAKAYRHIEVWGEQMGSSRSYIHEQQLLAVEDNAPLDAIYKRERWHTAGEVTNPAMQTAFEAAGLKPVKSMVEEEPNDG